MRHGGLRPSAPDGGHHRRLASPVYVLAVLLISRFTSGYLFGLIAAVLGVIGVNYVFTYPYMAFNFTISGYPLTMFTFLVVSLVTSTLTTKTKEQDRLRMENEKVKMRADLLRSVSHDIRTPLTSIMGATSAILENPALSPAEQQSLLVDVRDDAQWLIRVVENLLSITRIGNESAKITKEPEAAEEVLDEAVRKFRKRFPAVSVEVHVPDELLLVPMDAILIMQVLSNLMENAVFHGGTTTHIALSAQRDGPWAVLRAGQRPGHSPQKLHTCSAVRFAVRTRPPATESGTWGWAYRSAWLSSVPTAAHWKQKIWSPGRNFPSACRSLRRKYHDDS